MYGRSAYSSQPYGAVVVNNDSITLTGVAGTTAAAILSDRIDKTLTGSAATAALGTISHSDVLTGAATTLVGQVGTLQKQISEALASVVSSGTAGIAGPPPTLVGVFGIGHVQTDTEDLELNFMNGVLDPRLTYSRASFATDGFYTDATGSSYNVYGVDRPRMSAKGLLVEDTRTNYLLNSDTPVTQTAILPGANHLYSLWVIGSGSATVAAGTAIVTGTGTATAGVPVNFTVTTVGTVVVTVTGSLTRFQLEGFTTLASPPTSYIPTAGVAVTRQADVATMATGAWYNTTASTLAVEAMAPVAYPGGGLSLVELDDSTVNNRYQLFTQPGTTTTRSADYYTTNTTDILLQTGVVTAGVPFKLASTFTSGAASLVLNGGNANSGASAHWPGATFNRLIVAAVAFSSSNLGWTNSNGYIRRVRYWGRTLSLAELKQVTTQDPSVRIEIDHTPIGVTGSGQIGTEIEQISIGIQIFIPSIGHVGSFIPEIDIGIIGATTFGKVGVPTPQYDCRALTIGVEGEGQVGLSLPVVIAESYITTFVYDNIMNPDMTLFDPLIGSSIAASFTTINESYLTEIDLLLTN